MTSLIEQLSPTWNPESGPFTPVARYYPAMDHLLYLREDCPYRADRVDEWLTLLWHPYRWEVVGLKLKGIRVIFKELLSIPNGEQVDVLPIAEILADILMMGGAEKILKDHEDSRKAKLRHKYRLAVRFAANSNAVVSQEELRKAA